MVLDVVFSAHVALIISVFTNTNALETSTRNLSVNLSAPLFFLVMTKHRNFLRSCEFGVVIQQHEAGVEIAAAVEMSRGIVPIR
jgi:hypothetical protein